MGDEDVWFLLDHTRLGASTVTVDALETYLAVRHTGLACDRGHTWTHQGTGETVGDYTRHLQRYHRAPEDLLPDWALDAYRAIRAGEPQPSSP
jgi:hypothetical protein